MLTDFRLALRTLAKSPGFTAIAVLTLALGIGLVTVQFSLVYGALFKGLPFERSERIQLIATRNETRETLTSLRHFARLREQQHSFDFLAAYQGTRVNVSGVEVVARQYPGVACTSDVFAMTGVAPVLGRTLQPNDNQPGAPRVLVLGGKIWRNDFGSDPAVIGRSVRIDRQPATIIGVMPEDFGFPVKEQVWTNLVLPPTGTESWYIFVEVIGRLRADTTLAQARTELSVLAGSITRDRPKTENIGTRFTVMPFARYQVHGLDNVLYTLLAVVGLVLVLSCINVANLLHVRALHQQHDLAIRLALGAGRARLFRQSLIVSLLLASLGAVAGLLLAAWGAPIVNQFLTDPQKPYWVAVDVNGYVLGVAIALTIGVGVAAGMLPAWRSLRVDPLVALRDGGATSTAHGPARVAGVLTLAQIILSTTVLVIGAVLARGVHRAAVSCYPADTSRILTALTVYQGEPRASDDAKRGARQLQRTLLLSRVAALPGVQAVELTTRDPDRAGLSMPVEIEHHSVAPESRPQVPVEYVTPGYFRIFGIAPVRGRLFDAPTAANGDPVVIVNEAFARSFWPGGNPIGQRCRFEDAEHTPQWHTVVGVVPDLCQTGVGQNLHRPGAYLLIDTEAPSYRTNLLLVGNGDLAAYVRPLQTILHEIAPDQPFQSILTLDALIDRRLQLPRVISSLATVFGVAAAFLAAIGIYGTTAFNVERRRRELGLRLALGATNLRLIGCVLRRGLMQLAIGLPVGIGIGHLLNHPLQQLPMLRGIASAEPTDVALGVITVAVSLLLACWIPAHRATRINPIETLRAE
jgi:putative ABC transport system permease protein